MPPQNQIAAGSWLDDRSREASVEAGLAKTLDLKLGDRLRFDIGGQWSRRRSPACASWNGARCGPTSS